MGNLPTVFVYAVNIYDTKSGVLVARAAFEKYPSIQRFCADAGYRKTFEQDISCQLGLVVDISLHITNGISYPNGGSLSVCWLSSIIPTVFSKIMSYLSVPLRWFVSFLLSAFCRKGFSLSGQLLSKRFV